ncbi:VOC family protein [Paenibacillus sp. JCM 10914]|uniref:VOC family protein n=1 Tax=Paenibacillus sp. JCM 10914 TaxID=1236974 RepID=UPI00351BF797
MEEAKLWYADLLAIAPYFERSGPDGAVMFWHVDDLETSLHKLKAMGAKEYEPLIHREAGLITASVTDPFSNVLNSTDSDNLRLFYLTVNLALLLVLRAITEFIYIKDSRQYNRTSIFCGSSIFFPVFL